MTIPLRIGLDGQPLHGRRTGIGRYVFELCRALDSTLPNATFHVYSQTRVEMPCISPRWIARFDDRYARSKHPIWLKFHCGDLCKQDDLDVFWATGAMFPKLPKHVRRIGTVHDLNIYVAPHTMPMLRLWAHRAFFARDIKSADCICTVSRGTWDKLQQYVGRNADMVVYPAVDAKFVKASPSDIARVRAKYEINASFLLAVATLEPRKNLALLIDAFRSLKETGALSSEYELLLVGGKGWRDSALTRRIESHKSWGVRPLGYLPDEDLPALYTASEAFVFPSIYEGFGMPVLEARACGARVLTTDIPELREAGGNDAQYCAPTLPAIKLGILSILDSTRPVVRAHELPSWKRSAELFGSLLSQQLRPSSPLEK